MIATALADETAAPLRDAEGRVCATCRTVFPLGPAVERCPIDGGVLLDARALVDAGEDPILGRTVGGRFTVIARLGGGSMGTVYRARQDAMGRDVALKILRQDRTFDAQAKARFEREARANSVLVSPHTVTVFDFGEGADGSLFLAMEMLEGESLGQRLRRDGAMPIRDAVRVAREALSSLAEAHKKGIIHRDIKPDNVFLARQPGPNGGEPTIVTKVLDFGIAKVMREGEGVNALETQAGTVFGTPRFMSPEQAQGKPLDARSDLYSLGVILYQMLTGRPPFTDDDAIVVMARHIKTAPKPLSEACPEAAIPPDLERLVMRVLAKDPNDRPITADVFSNDLQRVLETGMPSTSGVRRSVAPAADAAIPMMSVPSPIPSGSISDLSLPTTESAGRRNVLIGIFLLALALVMGIVVFLGMKRPPPEPIASQRGPAMRGAEPLTTMATSPSADPTSTTSSTGLNPGDPPAISPDALPRARPSATAGAAGGGRPSGRPGPAGGRTPRPAPSASATGYGILD